MEAKEIGVFVERLVELVADMVDPEPPEGSRPIECDFYGLGKVCEHGQGYACHRPCLWFERK